MKSARHTGGNGAGRTTGALAAVGMAMIAAAAIGDVTLPPVIGNHMVLQCDAPLRIWGTASPSEKVSVTLLSQRVHTQADATGAWEVTLEASPAGGPYEMVVKGNNTIALTNVLCGEVWLGAGQSNLEQPLAAVNDASIEMAAAAKLPLIRFFTVDQKDSETPRETVTGRGWQVCARPTAEWFSAVMYLFGKNLHNARKVPVGLITSAKGGAGIRRWMSADALKAAGMQKDGDSSKLYNGAIHPLRNVRLRGVVWYQGETDASSGATYYRSALSAMIADWRRTWDNSSMYFSIVQLPNYQTPDSHTPVNDLPTLNVGWPVVRNDQALIAQNTPHCGLVITIDAGQWNDVHYKNKQPVGQRIALDVRANVYGEKDLVSSGPVYTGSAMEGSKMRIRFKHVGKGLASKSGELTGFSISGGGKHAWATAAVDGDSVIVSSPDVPAPEFVYYAWADDPTTTGNGYTRPPATLVNSEGLPAAPFRTNCPLQEPKKK